MLSRTKQNHSKIIYFVEIEGKVVVPIEGDDESEVHLNVRTREVEPRREMDLEREPENLGLKLTETAEESRRGLDGS